MQSSESRLFQGSAWQAGITYAPDGSCWEAMLCSDASRYASCEQVATHQTYSLMYLSWLRWHFGCPILRLVHMAVKVFSHRSQMMHPADTACCWLVMCVHVAQPHIFVCALSCRCVWVCSWCFRSTKASNTCTELPALQGMQHQGPNPEHQVDSPWRRRGTQLHHDVISCMLSSPMTHFYAMHHAWHDGLKLQHLRRTVQDEGSLLCTSLLSEPAVMMDECSGDWSRRSGYKSARSYTKKEPHAKCLQLGHMLWCSIQPEESKFANATHSHYQMALMYTL